LLDLRSPIILSALPAGLAVGALGWVVLGGASPIGVELDALQMHANASRAGHRATVSPGGDPISDILSMPIFALTTSAKAVAEISLRLDGVSRTPRRTAALVSINGGPAIWLSKGQTRDGMTVVAISSSQITVETALGERDVLLGQSSSGSAQTSSSPVAQVTAPSEIPSGMRLPPPPADAPKGG
jgi:hypothetical protein